MSVVVTDMLILVTKGLRLRQVLVGKPQETTWVT